MDLRGKTILITRAASQTEELRDGLARLGAVVVECPAIEVRPVEEWSRVDHAISGLDSYHWLLFTSVNAVEFFMKRVEAAGLAAVRTPIAVVGSATARKLAQWNLSPSVVPSAYRAEGLLEAFPADLTGRRILFPRAETARELLPDELRRRGAVVDVLPVYRTIRSGELGNIRQILASGVDCVVFTSPSTIRFMAEALEEDLAFALDGVPIAVIGPVTEHAAASFGLKPVIQPVRSTIEDLVEAIRAHFNLKA